MSKLTRYRVNEPCLYPLDRVPGGCTPPYVAIDVYKADDVARVMRMFLQDFIAKNAIGSKDRDAGVYLCGQCGNPYGANIALLECQHDKDCLILEAQRLLKELEP